MWTFRENADLFQGVYKYKRNITIDKIDSYVINNLKLCTNYIKSKQEVARIYQSVWVYEY